MKTLTLKLMALGVIVVTLALASPAQAQPGATYAPITLLSSGILTNSAVNLNTTATIDTRKVTSFDVQVSGVASATAAGEPSLRIVYSHSIDGQTWESPYRTVIWTPPSTNAGVTGSWGTNIPVAFGAYTKIHYVTNASASSSLTNATVTVGLRLLYGR
jgi:hypothetical protein